MTGVALSVSRALEAGPAGAPSHWARMQERRRSLNEGATIEALCGAMIVCSEGDEDPVTCPSCARIMRWFG